MPSLPLLHSSRTSPINGGVAPEASKPCSLFTSFARAVHNIGQSLVSSAVTKPLLAFTMVNAWAALIFGLSKQAPLFAMASPGTSNTCDALPQSSNHIAGAERFSGKQIRQYLHNGTFGAHRDTLVKVNGVNVARGDRLQKVISDPDTPGSGILLSDMARHQFDWATQHLGISSPKLQFQLAMSLARDIRIMIMEKLNKDPLAVHEWASEHAINSKRLPMGSPFVSLTLNNLTAAVFAIGGVDAYGRQVPDNEDGRIFIGAVNNASTIFPVVQGAVKGGKISPYVGVVSDTKIRRKIDDDDVDIPVAELLVAGGFYFHNSISIQEGVDQEVETLRSIPDLYDSNLSLRMIEPNHNPMRLAG